MVFSVWAAFKDKNHLYSFAGFDESGLYFTLKPTHEEKYISKWALYSWEEVKNAMKVAEPSDVASAVRELTNYYCTSQLGGKYGDIITDIFHPLSDKGEAIIAQQQLDYKTLESALSKYETDQGIKIGTKIGACKEGFFYSTDENFDIPGHEDSIRLIPWIALQECCGLVPIGTSDWRLKKKQTISIISQNEGEVI
jgi:hypothetical protein